MLALAYGAEGKKPEAIKAFEEGITNTKSALELVNNLVAIYNHDGQHDKAIALYEEAHKLHQDSLEVSNNLASYLTDYPRNGTDLETAAKLVEPLDKLQNPNAKDTIGWIAYKQGDYAKAQELLTKVVTALPESAIGNYHLGMIYLKQGDKVKAQELLKKAVDKKEGFIGLDTATETLKQLEAK